jgi:hypothetical protein
MVGFVRFDLSTFPAGSTVAAATLSLSVDDVKVDGVVEVRRVLGPWQEHTLTRNNQPGLGPVSALFTVSSADDGDVLDVNVTSLINELLANSANEYGIALTQAGANVWFDSRESGVPMSLTLTPGGPLPNAPPQVTAGDDQTVFFGEAAVLAGNVSDDGLPSPPGAVLTSWTKLSGPGTASFVDATMPVSSVSFDLVGDYVLRLAANDGEYMRFDDILVTVVEQGAQVDIQTHADTYTRNNAASSNFGADSLVRVQPWGDTTGFADFDLSGFPTGSTVANATLRVAVDTVKVSGDVQLRRVLGDWQEFSLTRNNQPALGPVFSTFSVDSNDEGKVLALDVTGLVNALLADRAKDYGLALTQSGANVWFDSREGGIPMTLTVEAGGPVANAPPTVNAGNDMTVALPDGASLSASIADDGLPNPPGAVALNWTVLSGPGAVTFANATSATTTASFSATGDYDIRLTANDGEFSVSDDINITVVDALEELNLTAVADTYTRNNLADSNFGNDSVVRVQPWGGMTGFVRFDLSSVPAGRVATSAVLHLAVDDVKVNGSVEFHKVLGAWQEFGLTHNNGPALGPAQASMNVSTADDGEIVPVDITTLVNALIADPGNDNGIAITQSGANAWFGSIEAGAPMVLEVELQALPPP